jgi:phosphoribosylanthranilate isomerase
VSIEVKICGVNTPEALRATVEAGAEYVGLNFYPRSPRAVTPDQAAALTAAAPPRLCKVGLFVDVEDETIAKTLAAVGLDMLQLHGGESPARVAEIRARFGLPVMKAVKIADLADVAAAEAYLRVADRLLFDAKPPKEMTGALPGGNALTFDWQLLAGKTWPIPWMLAGGLEAANVAEAARISGARALDVVSGVEDRPGLKNPDKIRAFLAAAKGR